VRIANDVGVTVDVVVEPDIGTVAKQAAFALSAMDHLARPNFKDFTLQAIGFRAELVE